jgi:hypothetical protein
MCSGHGAGDTLEDTIVLRTDPGKTLSLSRYRRTVAWHIARLPGGRIALAIRYGHLRATQSDAYGAMSRHGIRARS